MKTQQIGSTDLVTTRLAYGCMRIAGTWNPDDVDAEKRKNAHAALIAAYEAGYTLFDHADIYAQGACETLHGEVLREVPAMRDEIVIATKCGIRFDDPHRYDFSYEHILWSCDRSLERLGIETIDIYQLHRPDYLMDPLEVAEAFSRLHQQGKVRHFGVSNFLPDKVATLQAALPFPICVNQVEIHLGRRDTLEDGTLNQCLTERITPLAWSPLGGGWLGEGGERTGREDLLELMDGLAAAHSVTRTEIALAWLLKHPSGIVPIVGSANPERIRQATKADDVELSREDWYRLTVAARGEKLP